jgi:hypothetical protein
LRVERVELEAVGSKFEELVLWTPEVGVADGLPGGRQVVLNKAQELVTPANIKYIRFLKIQLFFPAKS